MAKYIICISLLMIIGCSNNKHIDRYYKGEIKNYHFICGELLDASYKSSEAIDGESIYYLGKIAINVKNGTIKCDCINEQDKEKVENLFEKDFKKYFSEGIEYSIYYESQSEEPKKIRKTDKVWHDFLYEGSGYIYTAAPYNSLDFWSKFRQKGIYIKKQDNKYDKCFPINSKMGEKYYKNKWVEEKNITELSKALFATDKKMPIIVIYKDKECFSIDEKIECFGSSELEQERMKKQYIKYRNRIKTKIHITQVD
ncbi:hypothetical protein Dip518_000061 [Parelusimicrobium proximum]|uniref:hypothetical protein n=1 Tax=Parelusimicrobium proximum TaxID=3228953 RepID=UPI003D179949